MTREPANANGRKSASGLFLAILVLLLPVLCRAEVPAPPEPPPYQLHRFDEDYSYLRDPARRTDPWDPVKFIPLDGSGSIHLSLGGEIRERYEYFNNANWGGGPQDTGGYLLQRYMLHADLRLGGDGRIFVQLKSGLEDGRAGGPLASDEDQLDLHQGFFELSASRRRVTPVTARVGRQELSFGSQRLISVREGPTVRQSFDGVRLILEGEARLDAIAVKPVETNRHIFDDGPDNTRSLWGVYAVTPLAFLPGGNADLYYLGLHSRGSRFDQGSARETRHSAGSRLWGRAGELDYNAEFVYQWGSFGAGTVQAWGFGSDTGYTLAEAPLTPRLGLKANIASGDRDPADADLETFNPLFPRGGYYSESRLVGPSNLADLHPAVDLRLTRSLTLTADWDFFWRTSTRDGIYTPAVSLARTGRTTGARYVGSQPQLILEWRPDRHVSVMAIYARFLAGPFLKESGSAKDVDYATAWVAYRF